MTAAGRGACLLMLVSDVVKLYITISNCMMISCFCRLLHHGLLQESRALSLVHSPPQLRASITPQWNQGSSFSEIHVQACSNKHLFCSESLATMQSSHHPLSYQMGSSSSLSHHHKLPCMRFLSQTSPSMRPLLRLSQYGAQRNISQSSFIMSNVMQEIASVKKCIRAAEKKLNWCT